MAKVNDYYDAVANTYGDQYDRDKLLEMEIYPADYFRMQMMLTSFLKHGVKRALEIGVGEGTPLSTLARAGVDVWGIDISRNMVALCQEKMSAMGADPKHIQWGDVTDPTTYVDVMREGPFDALMAMGVMPHVQNDLQTLKNMAACVRPGGKLFIEFRNRLFSLFTFNRYTHEFIMDDLLAGLDQEWKDQLSERLKPFLRLDMPPVRSTAADGEAPGYDAILSKFHNPLEIAPLFSAAGLGDLNFLWYHYHPSPPMLETEDPKGFRTRAFSLEHENSGWRGMFLCSAFVVEAIRL